MDTTSWCVNRTEPQLQDSLTLSAEQIISEKEHEKPNEAIKIYPNPSTGIVSVEYPAAEEVSQIYLYNQQGMLVRRFDEVGSGRLILSHLPKGVYFLRAKTPEGLFVRRLVLE